MRSSTHARYSQRYPRQGKAAILCEGDIAGYEVDLIEKWSAMKTDRAYVDVWPCGTRKAIFGVSDVLGRCVPIFVIEDHDFRTDELANRQCEENMNERKKRGVDLRFWRAWRRHEIENYLIEPAVVVPTLAAAFGVHESAVSSRLDTIIERSRIDQAAQSALGFYRSQLPETHKHIGGLPRKEARPLWDDNKREIVEPSAEVVESKLGEVLEASSAKLSKYDGTSNAKSALGLSQEGGFPGGSLWTISLEMCSIVGELTPIGIDGGSPMSTITQRIASAFVVLCGRYGDVTKMAHDREQSRQSLYREASQVANAVDGTAVQSRIDELQRQLAGQQAQIQDLQERLEHAIEITRDKQDEFASVAQAEGVSLSVARRLLQVVAGSVTTPSVPTLGRATEEAGQRAGQLLEVLDEVAQPKVKQATADEIFLGPNRS